MITLHQYPEAFGLSSLSPFCVKVEFFLRLTNIPYQVHVERNPARGPMGKMPFIEVDRLKVADSSLILDFLVEKYDLSEYAETSPEARAFKTMIEESLYFILLYSRWVDEDGYKIIQREFLPLFPPLIGRPFLSYLRRSLSQQARAQGTGRFTKAQAYDLGQGQLLALSQFLGEREHFFGGRISTFDASCYAFLSTILKQPIESPLKRGLLKHANLCAYVDRLDAMMKK